MNTAASVFLHSTGTGPRLWSFVSASALAPDVRVMPCNLGYPPGAPVAQGETVRLADEVAHVLAQLPPEGPIDLYGHSYGATVALELVAALGPRLRGLYLYEPVLFGALNRAREAHPEARDELAYFQENSWFLEDLSRGGTDPWLAAFIDYWNRPGSFARMPPAMQAYTRSVGWKMFQEVRAVFYDVGAFAPAAPARVVTTLVLGARSTASSRAMTRRVAALTPHATLEVIDEIGHMGVISHAPRLAESVMAHRARVLAATLQPDVA